MEREFVDIEKPDWLLPMEGILETLNEGVIVADDCARILFINSTFEAMTGMPREDVVGKDLHHFYSPEEADVILAHRERSIRDGHGRLEFVVPRKEIGRAHV